MSDGVIKHGLAEGLPAVEGVCPMGCGRTLFLGKTAGEARGKALRPLERHPGDVIEEGRGSKSPATARPPDTALRARLAAEAEGGQP